MKIKIVDDIKNLAYFKRLFDMSDNIEIVGEMEIEPFQKFKSDFCCAYWYLQYSLLKNGRIIIDKNEILDEYNDFFNGTDVNFIWVQIQDKPNYVIKCIDGKWSIEIFNDNYYSIVSQYGEGWILED